MARNENPIRDEVYDLKYKEGRLYTYKGGPCIKKYCKHWQLDKGLDKGFISKAMYDCLTKEGDKEKLAKNPWNDQIPICLTHFNKNEQLGYATNGCFQENHVPSCFVTNKNLNPHYYYVKACDFKERLQKALEGNPTLAPTFSQKLRLPELGHPKWRTLEWIERINKDKDNQVLESGSLAQLPVEVCNEICTVPADQVHSDLSFDDFPSEEEKVTTSDINNGGLEVMLVDLADLSFVNVETSDLLAVERPSQNLLKRQCPFPMESFPSKKQKCLDTMPDVKKSKLKQLFVNGLADEV